MIRWGNGSAAASSGTASGESVSPSGSTGLSRRALAKGFAEAIALGTDGMLSEGSGQNLFLVRRGALHTPPIDGTLLPGITRETVLSLASDAGIPIREEPLPREMLYVADEVFLSGTASEITPIRSVDKITVGAGKPGPVTKELQRLFMATVRGESEDPHGWLTYVRAERADARSLGGRASANR